MGDPAEGHPDNGADGWRRIAVATPSLSDLEARYVAEAVESTWIGSHGRFIGAAEDWLAEASGARHAIVTSSGTAALHLVLAALGLGPGDEVIVPSLTYVATANAVSYTGAEVVFADVREDSWTLDPASVRSVVGERTRGIIPVHLYGHPSDMDALQAVADEHALWMVEDAAEALFAKYRGKPVGGLGTAGIFSFFGNKVLTSGEGGGVVTDDPSLALQLRQLRNQGMDPERRYYFPVIGFNYRMTNLAAAVLCAQFERSAELMAGRARVYDAYDAALTGFPAIHHQPVMPWATRTPWLYSVLLDEQAACVSRDELLVRLGSRGVDTRPFFVPLHTLPPYRAARRAESLEVTERLSATGLNLPTAASMDGEDVDYVKSAISQALASSPTQVPGGAA